MLGLKAVTVVFLPVQRFTGISAELFNIVYIIAYLRSLPEEEFAREGFFELRFLVFSHICYDKALVIGFGEHLLSQNSFLQVPGTDRESVRALASEAVP